MPLPWHSRLYLLLMYLHLLLSSLHDGWPHQWMAPILIVVIETIGE
jgi:hypothetical protein